MATRVENQLLLHQLYRTCNGDLPDIFKKKKCKGNVTKEKSLLLLFLKKEQTTKKSKNKTNCSSVLLFIQE